MVSAYLDAGSGSVIATFLVAGFASIGVALKTMRARVAGVFGRGKKDAPEAETIDANG